MSRNKNTEQKIFDAATELFLEKGVDRTSVRDIASKAGINLALMNYYFRSKENLFDAIFSMLVQKNTSELIKIMDADISLEEKIKAYVEEFINILLANPLLVSFFMSILHRSREKITQMQGINSVYSTEIFARQIQEEAEKGNIKDISPSHFFVDMISLIAFPFAIRHLIMARNQMNSDAEFIAFIQERKEHVQELLIRNLKPCQ